MIYVYHVIESVYVSQSFNTGPEFNCEGYAWNTATSNSKVHLFGQQLHEYEVIAKWRNRNMYQERREVVLSGQIRLHVCWKRQNISRASRLGRRWQACLQKSRGTKNAWCTKGHVGRTNFGRVVPSRNSLQCLMQRRNQKQQKNKERKIEKIISTIHFNS